MTSNRDHMHSGYSESYSGYSYDEATEPGFMVTAAQVRRELRRHDTGETEAEKWAAFTAEYGEREEYEGSAVLGWLGY